MFLFSNFCCDGVPDIWRGGGYGEGWFGEAQPTSPDITHILAVVKDLNNISTSVTCAPFTTYMALMQK